MATMHRRSRLLACALALGLALAPAIQQVPLTQAAQSTTLQVLPDAAARLNAYLTAQTRAHHFSGAVLLAQGDTVLLSKGYGMADWSNGIHNSADTVFPIPGQMFEFAAAAVLWLEDAGKLHEGDHICTYIPRCPAIWAPITIHEILTDTSGLDDFINHPSQPSIEGKYLSLAQIMIFMSHEPMAHKPGTTCCTSANDDQIIQEYLVEQVTGESYGIFLQQHFLGPLGLTHTHYSLHAPNVSPHAVGYTSWQQPAYSMDDDDFSDAGGMLYSTLPDVLRWEQALHTSRVLSARSTARILLPVSPSVTLCVRNCGEELTQENMSDGWVVGTFRQHHVVLSGVGGFDGFWSGDRYFPDEKVTVIDLSNLDVAASVPISAYVTQANRAIFGS